MDGTLVGTSGKPTDASPLAQSGLLTEPGASAEAVNQPQAAATSERDPLKRATSTSSTKVDGAATPSRIGTLRRNPSSRKRMTLGRRDSKRSVTAGSTKDTAAYEEDDDFNNVFHVPIPTSGNPTEILSNRFQAWRKLLKDLITYFREIQTSYENRSKSLIKVSNVINNTVSPPLFLTQGGIDDAVKTLRNFHKASLAESNKAKDIEDDVITQLNGLRNDLTQKIKEIKSLSGDFKNSVDKEKDGTKRAVGALQESLSSSNADPVAASGKGDPYLLRLAVDRQVEKQIEEENYLHRAYLNLEGSGRELESIVVGEIQKAYNAYVGILRRETEHAQEAIEDLRAGPIAMSKDHEWINFVEHDEHFINPNIPLRKLENVYYPGKFNPATAEIRLGMLERKSKYLKSYTPGWYVLSATHLHEFKSADHYKTQTPVMSLYLLDQELGAHSQPGASSHKFSFKGRQTGAMHRGHSWVFRAESYETMMAWYNDIKNLIEKTGEDKLAYVRKHAHTPTAPRSTKARSVGSEMDEDEADTAPYAGAITVSDMAAAPAKPVETADTNVNSTSQPPLAPIHAERGAGTGAVMAAASSPTAAEPMPASDQFEAVQRHDQDLLPAAAPSTNALDQEPESRDISGSVPVATATETTAQNGVVNLTEQPPTTLREAASPDTVLTDNASELPSTPLAEPDMDTSISPVSTPSAVASVPISSVEKRQHPKIFQPARQPQPLHSIMESVIKPDETSDLQPNGVEVRPSGYGIPAIYRKSSTTSSAQMHVPGGFPPTPGNE